MTLLGRLKDIFNSTADPEKRSILSRRFIIIISIIYSALILGISASFQIIMYTNAGILRDALVSHNQDVLIEKIGSIVDRLRLNNAASVQEIKRNVRALGSPSGDILAVIILAKTADENFYRVAETVSFHSDFNLGLKPSAVVRERKEINYLKRGLLQCAVDPTIYSQNGYYWQSVYHPYEVNRKRAILQFLVSVSRTQEILEGYAEDTGGMRVFIIVLTVVLVIAVVALSVIFIHNYSLLLRNLSSSLKKAAGGDLGVSLNPTGDDELNQLARSFNTLIEELKDKTGRSAPEPEPAPEAEGIGSIFGTGVSLLKKNRLDEAIAIFTALTVLKPQGFGSWFNLGVAHAKKREYDTALRMFEEARRINPAFAVTGAYIEKIRKLRNPDA
ncbi:MAG: hypothetical protein A2176_08260 [Spirochaetes bacterium RBG_13_51_14]|nr:MAG: hypothetical protein A2176_08260 [Spirochaetes bacterium RBG_13_51_14]